MAAEAGGMAARGGARAWTRSEMADRFVAHVGALVDYWGAVPSPELDDRLGGLAFGFLALLDGESGGHPACLLVPDPPPGAREDAIVAGGRYFPELAPGALAGRDLRDDLVVRLCVLRRRAAPTGLPRAGQAGGAPRPSGAADAWGGPISPDEAAERVVDAVAAEVVAWREAPGTAAARLHGLALGLLTLVELGGAGMPPCAIVPEPHTDERTVRSARGEPYYDDAPLPDGLLDLAGALHELYRRHPDRHP